jgi:hypothetical protein
MARARCSPGTNPAAPPTSAPAMATPSALPTCRALLSSPATAPPRLADRLFALGWVARTGRRRVVRVTGSGSGNLPAVLGLPADWDQPGH